ncbi:Tom37 C-terminal domain-containing protein [Hyaloscypha finlandica]|nr:Tom37 C-terminal domain-containing protein [Hyaloscypha finlandica]
MLELHVWGPAFGLPSLDAHCLAAIAYLQQAVPRGKWQLIASCNPALSPTNELPALRNGDIWIGGFRNIFHYLAQCSAGEWVLDAGLPEQEGADCIAFSSFVESHGQPLIDLSLYVSQNYTTTTQPLYSALLPFPLPYLTPPSIRATAKLRTAHLGLSSLDIDSDDSTPPPSQSIIPESLRRPRSTVSSLLAASPEASAQIRLDALATAFLEPLEKLRAKKQLFVSESQFTSLDCLVLGYLSLMLVPDLPQPWLAQCLKKKFPSLCAWTEELRKNVFGPEVTVHDAFLTKLGDSELDLRLKRLRGRGHLPWKAPDNGGAVGIGSVFLSGVADGIPVVGQLRRNTRMRQHGGLTTEDGVESSSFQYLTLITGLVAGLGAVAGYMFHQGLISFGAGEETKEKETGGGLGALGEAGAALGFYASQMDEQVRRQRVMEEMNETHGAPVAEVDVDVEVERKPLRG